MFCTVRTVPFVARLSVLTLASIGICFGQSTVASSVTDHPLGEQTKRLPKHFSDGTDLPNGWRITPAGKAVGEMGDLVMNLVSSPDGKVVISVNSGFLPHGLDVFDAKTHQHLQHIGLTSTWLGMAWSSDGHTLYVSGGNASGAKSKADPVAPIYEFTYANGRLSDQPTGKLVETIDPKGVWWSGVAYLPGKHVLYAANRGTGSGPGNIVAFDAKTKQIVTRIPVETTPYETLLSRDGKYLFVSNWSSESISVIDTGTNKVVRTLRVGMNPNDMKLSADGRLFVACSNDNTVYVIDAHKLEVLERLSTTLTPFAPEGSTPDALAVDDERKLLYIANADNNSIAVAHIENRAHSTVVGFIPTGWYPSALLLTEQDRTLFIGNAKGEEGHPDPDGPHFGHESDKTLQKSSLEVLSVANLKEELPRWTRQVTEDTPYHDSLLSEARMPQETSVIPQHVGEASEIKHIIYIIKENRTYDQEFGDIANANGDPKLVLFGEKVTPNQHALAKEYVVLDNLYCDGEVSVDGHSWSNSAYATDFNEKQWPPEYGGHSTAAYTVRAMVPSGGHLWDLARRKGLTYRSYGENAARASTGTTMEAAPGADGLVGHVSKEYGVGLNMRDTDKVAVFLKDLKGFEDNYDSTDPQKRLPNYTVMSMPEDHTRGTSPGAFTPQAMVANNDYAIGQLVDGVSHSRYWANTAIFIIEDDAQDGADHVDGRRTVGLVISPYVKRGMVDSTLYTTSSMVRSMELLLGLPPMSQYDAAAMPMYSSFGATSVIKPFTVIPPMIDVNVKNTKDSFGSKESSKMNFKELDHAPMYALNEIIWKSIRGKDSAMPAPVHRFRPLADASESVKGDKDDE
ncbi:MAG TPA: alkaline phosphatase family protein [Edaphobacter sp.]|nr:alkaline phosphatase family protein [Edaphobacter sp.]